MVLTDEIKAKVDSASFLFIVTADGLVTLAQTGSEQEPCDVEAHLQFRTPLGNKVRITTDGFK